MIFVAELMKQKQKTSRQHQARPIMSDEDPDPEEANIALAAELLAADQAAAQREADVRELAEREAADRAFAEGDELQDGKKLVPVCPSSALFHR